MAQVLVGKFTIPTELAKELSDLLAKQMIREHVLQNVINDREKFEEIEAQLIPVVQKIDAIKAKITSEYVPAEFCNEKYTWNFDGYEVAENELHVYEMM